MSGTGQTSVEQHLGDRLAALVDGELKHDARERVLAHLATCTKCKAEAAAQRRLKSVFAQSAPPSPSEGFLARLQGLPGGSGGDDENRERPFGGAGRFADGLFPVIQPSGSRTAAPENSPLGFGFLTAQHGSTAVLPGGTFRSGFRIHEVDREADRSPWRGRRFAFAAASAVSLAAIALGGALPTGAGPGSSARAAGGGNAVNPLDAASRSESGSSVSRRGGGSQGSLGVTEASDRSTGAAPPPHPVPEPAPAASSAPSALNSTVNLAGNTFAVQLLTNVSTPPLIRPSGTTPLFARVLGRLAPQRPEPSAQPSWTRPPASAPPTPVDRGLPVSAQR